MRSLARSEGGGLHTYKDFSSVCLLPIGPYLSLGTSSPCFRHLYFFKLLLWSQVQLLADKTMSYGTICLFLGNSIRHCRHSLAFGLSSRNPTIRGRLLWCISVNGEAPFRLGLHGLGCATLLSLCLSGRFNFFFKRQIF